MTKDPRLALEPDDQEQALDNQPRGLAGHIRVEGRIVAKKHVDDASWSDLFIGEKISEAAHLNLAKIQRREIQFSKLWYVMYRTIPMRLQREGRRQVSRVCSGSLQICRPFRTTATSLRSPFRRRANNKCTSSLGVVASPLGMISDSLQCQTLARSVLGRDRLMQFFTGGHIEPGPGSFVRISEGVGPRKADTGRLEKVDELRKIYVAPHLDVPVGWLEEFHRLVLGVGGYYKGGVVRRRWDPEMSFRGSGAHVLSERRGTVSNSSACEWRRRYAVTLPRHGDRGHCFSNLLGGLKGGKARASALAPKKHSVIARAAARKRGVASYFVTHRSMSQ